MRRVSQKCQYALRVVLELARRQGQGPTPVRELAERQAVPSRFLELIAKDLRRARMVRSVRGARGGYELVDPPAEVTVGHVMRLFDGPFDLVGCQHCGGERECPLAGRCAFEGMWNDARDRAVGIYDSTTFADLLERENQTRQAALNYAI